MENIDEVVKNLYLKDEYITKNPSLHEEDSPWKVSKIMPLLDKFIACKNQVNENGINLLDVGGGAGLILNETSNYVKKNYGFKVNKYALDLSPGMLEVQKVRNPDYKKALSEDIRKTSLGNKEIDLTLMIDVLEHVPNPAEALEEVKRISGFVLFKVPLEDNLFSRTWNFVRRGEPRQHAIETVGHINIYNFNKLKNQIEEHMGTVMDYDFTNVFDYTLKSDYYKSKMTPMGRLLNLISLITFRLSPNFCSYVFGDFVVMLIKCYWT